MRLGEIDYNLKPIEFKLFLCKPDTTVISPMRDIMNESITARISEVGELSFSISTKVERNRELIDNPLIEKIKHRYLIKALFNNQVEYFIFLEDNKSLDSSGETISYKAYGRGYALADKMIKSYLAESKTLSEIGQELLKETIWKIGYVDAYFDTLYRTYEVPSQTSLEAMYGLAEKFKAIIVWDTVNLTINFYQPSRIDANRGLRFKEGKYLESFSVQSNARDTITRLRVYGAEGLTFRSLTPTGANYIEDFSWYMYPFESGEDGNVIKSSYYFSDELCLALEHYTETLADAQGEFESLLDELLSKQNSVQKEEQALSVMQTKLIQIVESIDVLNASGDSGTPEHQSLIVDRDMMNDSIAEKQLLIASINKDIEIVEEKIDNLRVLVNIENHLSRELLLELNEFIIEKEYINETIVYEEDLLEDGIKEFNRLSKPSVDISMNIVNFLSVIEAQHDWNKLRLGDVVKIMSKRLRTSVEARIMEIVYDIANNSITLRVANENDLKDDYDKMIDEVYKASSTSNIVNMDRYKWNMAEDAKDGVSQILNSTWDATKRGIQAGYKQMLDITERGIFVRSPENPRELLVLQNGVLALSNNGGDDWNLAINPSGVFAERLVGRIIMGNKLVIENEDGTIQMNGPKQEIFDKDGNVKVALGEYERGKYGIKIDSGALEIVGGIDANHINPDVYEEFSYDDTDLKNSLRLTSPLPNSLALDSDGITAYTPDTSRFARLDYRGLYVQGGAIEIRTSSSGSRGVVFDGTGISGYNSSGTRTFHLDTDGNFTASSGTFSGRLNSASGTFNGTLSAVDGTFRGTLSGVNGTFTNLSSGTITGATITGGSLTNQMSSSEYVTINNGGVTVAGNYIGNERYTTHLTSGRMVSYSRTSSSEISYVNYTEHDGNGMLIESGLPSGNITQYRNGRITVRNKAYPEHLYPNMYGTLFIEADTVFSSDADFRGAVRFHNATVTGLTTTAVLG